jgi:Domain of unknown function (DUF4349)
MKKRALAVVAFLALAGVVGFVARGGPGTVTSSSSSGASASGGEADRAAPLPMPSPAGADAKLPESEPLSVDLGPSALPGVGAEVIKDARISLRVKRNGLQDTLDAATATAGRFGGYVQSSSSSDRSGSVLLRVPASSFEAALGSLKGLGTVTSQTVSGKDVTSQFVDLNARLITWRTQESVLLRLMDQATSISDTLRVQSQLQQVQFRIEQIRGALRVLRDQTSYSTIQVAVREVGAPVVSAQTATTPSLVRAVQLSWAGFLSVVSTVIVGLGYLVPLGLIALAGWGVFRRVARERPAPAVTPAS